MVASLTSRDMNLFRTSIKPDEFHEIRLLRLTTFVAGGPLENLQEVLVG